MPKPSTQSPARRSDELPVGYTEFLTEVQGRIAAAQTRAVLAVNNELIQLYWEIGRGILDREEQQGWGAKIVDRLAADLRRQLPSMTGFSPRNLRYMRDFARAWGTPQAPDEILQQPVARLPWGHNITLLTKLQDRPLTGPAPRPHLDISRDSG